MPAFAPSSPRSIRRLVAPLVVGAVLGAALAGPAAAGFEFRKKGKKKSYSSRGFTSAESTAVLCAIEEIGNMGTSDSNPQTENTLLEIYTCLRLKLAFGGLCALTGGKNKSLAATMNEKPPKCTCSGDKIAIKEKMLSKSEPTFSMLVGVLVHEGIHTLEWGDTTIAPPDSTFDTPPTDEWASYGWETYIYCRRLAESGLSTPDSTEVAKRKDYTTWRTSLECDPSLTDGERRSLIKECSADEDSKAVPGETYSQRPGDSSRIRVGDASSYYEIQTPFVRTFGLAVEADLGGGDVLVVIGDDGLGLGGAVAYTDITFDGLADQGSELNLGTLSEPVSLDFRPVGGGLPGQLFVLTAAGDVFTALTDGAGHPQPLNVTPFASAGGFPFLADMVSVEAGEASLMGGVSIYVSDVEDETDVIRDGYTAYLLVDLDSNGVADLQQTVGWEDDVESYRPTIVNDPQAGDMSVETAGVSGHTLEIRVTDAGAGVLGELLASVAVASPDHVRTIAVPLNRPLLSGEYIVSVDATTGDKETAGTPVHPGRPEITGMSRPVYGPGDDLVLYGRNFGTAPSVSVSGVPVAVTAHTSTEITATADFFPKRPNNFHALRVRADGKTSDAFGVYVGTDCNSNGVDDPVDIETGASADANGDGIPDECATTTVPPPATPTPAKLGQAHPNPFGAGTVIAYSIAEPEMVTLIVFDVMGRRVRTLVSGRQEPRDGGYRVSWDGRTDDGRPAPAGLYLYRLAAGTFVESRRMVLLR